VTWDAALEQLEVRTVAAVAVAQNDSWRTERLSHANGLATNQKPSRHIECNRACVG
jgi:hypothetical protein